MVLARSRSASSEASTRRTRLRQASAVSSREFSSVERSQLPGICGHICRNQSNLKESSLSLAGEAGNGQGGMMSLVLFCSSIIGPFRHSLTVSIEAQEYGSKFSNSGDRNHLQGCQVSDLPLREGSTMQLKTR
jgi:hypothetical protein